jgi:nitroreductase
MLKKLRTLAKAMLAVTRVRRSYEAANQAFLEVFGSNRLLAHIGFTLFPVAFNREQAAVLRGRRNYYRQKQTGRRSHVELRRNIHRLEKGLIMMPRRDVFAGDYITETIEFFEVAAAQYAADPGSIDTGEIRWAHDVLVEYFKACTGSLPAVDDARARFDEIDFPDPFTGKVPYNKTSEGHSTITYEQLAALTKQRRSVRFFDERPVPRDDIDRALELARQAPTACNRLPYEFRIFDDPEMVRTVADLPFGAVGYSHQIPTIVVVVGKLDSYFSPRDRHAIYVDASLATMTFVYALETLGLSSTLINWPDFEPLERAMQRTLGLDLAERVVMLVAVGYAHPEANVPYSEKKELDTFRRYNVLRG